MAPGVVIPTLSCCLQVEAVGGAFVLSVEDVLLGLLEVLVRDLHPPLPEGQQTGLSADGLDVSTRKVILKNNSLDP